MSSTSDGADGCSSAPVGFKGRKLNEPELIDGAQLGGATPLWQWIDEGATLFSY